MIVKAYRRLMPESFRKSIWFIRNLISHAFSDKVPQSWHMKDYETYWQERIDKGDIGIAYLEIIDICASLIPEGGLLLDIGCGSGKFIQELQLKLGPKLKAKGLDVSSHAVEVARSRGVDAAVCDASHADLSVFGTFDVITSFEVLEHIPSAEALLINIGKWFPNSQLIVSVPNTGYLSSRIRLLFGRFPRQWVVHPAEHLRFWTLHDFQLMLDSLGFELLELFPLGNTRHSFLAKRWPSLFAEAMLLSVKKRTS